MTYLYRVEWSSSDPSVETVQVTGNFDDWSRSLGSLEKSGNVFTGYIRANDSDELVFKFILNGSEWQTSDQYHIVHDENGIANNIANTKDLKRLEEFEKSEDEGGLVPESMIFNDQDVAGKSPSVSDSDKPGLTQVLTSESSYAALSTPGSSSSTYHHIDSNEGRANTDELADDQFNTPTNSIIDSADHNAEGFTSKDDPTSGIPGSLSANSNNVPRANSLSTIQILPKQSDAESQATVSHPSNQSKNSKSQSKNQSSSKGGSSLNRREGLLSKFKSIFKS